MAGWQGELASHGKGPQRVTLREWFLLHRGRGTGVSCFPETLRPVTLITIFLYDVNLCIMRLLARVTSFCSIPKRVSFPFCMGHSLGHC